MSIQPAVAVEKPKPPPPKKKILRKRPRDYVSPSPSPPRVLAPHDPDILKGAEADTQTAWHAFQKSQERVPTEEEQKTPPDTMPFAREHSASPLQPPTVLNVSLKNRIFALNSEGTESSLQEAERLIQGLTPDQVNMLDDEIGVDPKRASPDDDFDEEEVVQSGKVRLKTWRGPPKEPPKPRKRKKSPDVIGLETDDEEGDEDEEVEWRKPTVIDEPDEKAPEVVQETTETYYREIMRQLQDEKIQEMIAAEYNRDRQRGEKKPKYHEIIEILKSKVQILVDVPQFHFEKALDDFFIDNISDSEAEKKLRQGATWREWFRGMVTLEEAKPEAKPKLGDKELIKQWTWNNETAGKHLEVNRAFFEQQFAAYTQELEKRGYTRNESGDWKKVSKKVTKKRKRAGEEEEAYVTRVDLEDVGTRRRSKRKGMVKSREYLKMSTAGQEPSKDPNTGDVWMRTLPGFKIRASDDIEMKTLGLHDNIFDFVKDHPLPSLAEYPVGYDDDIRHELDIKKQDIGRRDDGKVKWILGTALAEAKVHYLSNPDEHDEARWQYMTKAEEPPNAIFGKTFRSYYPGFKIEIKGEEKEWQNEWQLIPDRLMFLEQLWKHHATEYMPAEAIHELKELKWKWGNGFWLDVPNRHKNKLHRATESHEVVSKIVIELEKLPELDDYDKNMLTRYRYARDKLAEQIKQYGEEQTQGVAQSASQSAVMQRRLFSQSPAELARLRTMLNKKKRHISESRSVPRSLSRSLPGSRLPSAERELSPYVGRHWGGHDDITHGRSRSAQSVRTHFPRDTSQDLSGFSLSRSRERSRSRLRSTSRLPSVSPSPNIHDITKRLEAHIERKKKEGRPVPRHWMLNTTRMRMLDPNNRYIQHNDFQGWVNEYQDALHHFYPPHSNSIDDMKQLFDQVRGQDGHSVHGSFIRPFVTQRAQYVRLLNKRHAEGTPLSAFPYKTGEYAYDDKDHKTKFGKFEKHARLLDPLINMRGQKTHIGKHVSICVTPTRFHFIIYKGVPPKGLKMLCQRIKGYINSLPSANVELFKEVGSEWKLILSAKQLSQAIIKEVARVLIKQMKSNPLVHYILLQTM